MQLTQKETSLLKDLKDQEQICVEKYTKYSSEAVDPQLKNLFTKIAQTEKQHLDTVTEILNGEVRTMQLSAGEQQQQTFAEHYPKNATNQDKKKDSYLCTDALSTEKHVSSTYNTSIFEFRNTDIRNILNHIQKEEQQHGELIYNYMEKNGMYS